VRLLNVTDVVFGYMNIQTFIVRSHPGRDGRRFQPAPISNFHWVMVRSWVKCI